MHTDYPHLTPAQQGEILFLREALEKAREERYKPENRKIMTLDDLFEDCPKGDFSYEGEPEDVGNAWNCGESDCEHGWHESIQIIEQGRKDGKTWFIILQDSIAGCGDYQPEAGWDEREGDEVNQGILEDLWFHLEGRTIDHFYGWGMYSLDVALTGKDPITHWGEKKWTTEQALESARRNLEYLKK